MSKSSKKSIRALIVALLCAVILTGMGLSALAAPTIDRTATGSLTIQPTYGQSTVNGGTFKLYYVASIDNTANLSYTLDGAFSNAAVDVNSLKYASDIAKAAKTLSGYAQNVPAGEVITFTHSSSSNTVSGLKLGVYLIVQTSAPGNYTVSDPLLAYIPMTNSEGTDWVYSYTAKPKLGYVQTPVTVEISVEKSWYDTGYEDERPESVSVSLFRDGVRYGSSVTLSDSNGWSHSWTGLSSSYTWSVEEDEVPDGYYAVIDEEDGVFSITNMHEDGPPLGSTVSVSKVWAGDTEDIRPSDIQVTLLRDGEAYETVTLSSGNSWSYLWTELDAGYTWTVEETSVPTGYTSSVELFNNAYTITNTYSGTEPSPSPSPSASPEPTASPSPSPSTSASPSASPQVTTIPDEKTPTTSAPQTGMLQWPIPVLTVFGLTFITGGAAVGRGKKRRED